MRLLIIDDDPMMRTFLETMFSADFDIETAPDGAAALSRLQNADGQPDLHLVIADLSMPAMDGFEFTERLRADDDLRRLPLLILSGSDKSEDRIRILRLGADDFLVKPFNPEE
ncbi:MAG: response regulator transcription factor, partial [Bacteroidota bacterium]